MKLPLSNRLLACAALVPPGSRVADVGADHAYLAIHLLQSGRAGSVIASDKRAAPLARGRAAAERFGVAQQLRFRLCDGLAAYAPGEVDCIVCAGMGGDTIAAILDAASWVRDAGVTLVLQPQSSGNDLRRYLGQAGYRIEEECLARDGGFLYTALRARFGGGVPLSPGQQYCSPALLAGGGEELRSYLLRVIRALRNTVAGLQNAQDPARLAYYATALREVEEMERSL